MFCNVMVQRPTSLSNVGLQTLIAGSTVHHIFSLPFWDGVLTMDQILTQGSEGAKDDLNSQGAVPFCASVFQSLNSKGMDSDLYRKQAYKQSEIIRVSKMPKKHLCST